MASSDQQLHTRWNLAAALSGWLLPGLGHFLLGQRRRGLVIAASLWILWLGGLTLGGISVIDHRTHPVWFAGQMLMSPTVWVDLYHQRLMKEYTHRLPMDRSWNGEVEPDLSPAFEPSFSHIHEEGTLCVALAGLLNLLAILDLIYRDPSDSRYRSDKGIAEHAAARGRA